MDKEGGAVALITTINLEFGSKVMDHETGIVFNNDMDDFSSPGLVNVFGFLPSPDNFIQPAVGACGGSYITIASIQAILNICDLAGSVNKAIAVPCAHHQLMPDEVTVEPQYVEHCIESLEALGHNVTRLATTQCVVQAVSRLPSGYF
ncbi:hypothetical protein K7432_018383 [Basidiobolus ranarum]|uniref:Uncharacterized protein n=1 Tax=Basidiobolus ranarum TaxID=34480 RepID=A0ABR2VK68_9FUNG